MIESPSPEELQGECFPVYLRSEGRAQCKECQRNLVIMMHGFSTCPGTWLHVGQAVRNAGGESIALTLRERGYPVMLPLLPGHGRKPTNSTDVECYEKWPDCKWGMLAPEEMPTTIEPYLA